MGINCGGKSGDGTGLGRREMGDGWEVREIVGKGDDVGRCQREREIARHEKGEEGWYDGMRREEEDWERVEGVRRGVGEGKAT